MIDRPNIADQQSTAQAELAILRKVEQMAAYYEAPEGFFKWIDQQVKLRGGTPSASGLPAGLTIQSKGVQE